MVVVQSAVTKTKVIMTKSYMNIMVNKQNLVSSIVFDATIFELRFSQSD